jgi:hypothetical protein
LRLIALVPLLLAPGLATAQVYKCVDKEGRVKYVQTKPKGDECSGNVSSAPPLMGTGDGADPYKDIGAQAQERQAAEGKAREQAAEQQEQKAQRCAQWRARLAALERASHVFKTDEKGERQYNTAQQNDALREEARQGVAQECS